jgi:Fanconi anemia group M protein
MEIVADDRERGAGVIEALLGCEGLAVRVRRLRLGDYLVDGRLLVERKTVRDFAVSILDRRLFSQVYRMVQTGGKRICLILEGSGSDLLATGMSREALQGALTTVTLVHGMPVLRSRDPRETASLIATASRQLEARALGLPPRHGYKPKSMERVRLALLQAVPGVGRTRAKALLERFDTPTKLCAATRDELAAVRGIGDTTARSLWEVLHGERDGHEAGAGSTPGPPSIGA